MPSLSDLCFYNRAFDNTEERDWYSGLCSGCVCLLGPIIFLGARNSSDVAALPWCGLGLWALKQEPGMKQECSKVEPGRPNCLSGEQVTMDVPISRSLRGLENVCRKWPRPLLGQSRWTNAVCSSVKARRTSYPLCIQEATFWGPTHEVERGRLCWVLSVSVLILSNLQAVVLWTGSVNC